MLEDEFAIWPAYEAFYLRSMLFNSCSAANSIDQVAAVVEAIDGMTEDDARATIDSTTFLDQLQNIVLQAAALSRYFWPVRKKPEHISRSKILRSAFGVDEASPLHSRDQRNSLEHFDERLDAYLRSGIVGVILPEYVGMRPVDQSMPYHLFRAYYLDDGTFSLLGEEHSMPSLVDEVLRIHNRVVELDQTGGRLRDFSGPETPGIAVNPPSDCRD